MNPNLEATEPSTDALAVEAIRAGDRDRYRELVDRHASKVFAIAWCRLGDRDLAEEAAQEAFISAYRRLPLLGHAEKFGAWIAAITRNAAINLGIRRRGELRKRERWALEQDPAVHASPDTPPSTREMLREALHDLPAIHRECLVLFYLENQSVAESAETLGISENALKVRLHRARAMLRDTLETRLESGLDQLRAPSHFTHAVMIALPAAPSGGFLAWGGIAAALAKAIPFSLVLVALQVVSTIPGLLVARWIGHKELANFREPQGFRGQLYRRFLRGMLIAIFLILAGVHLATAGLGLRVYSILFGAFFVVSGLDHLRRLHIIRNPLHLASTVGILLLSVPLLGLGLLEWNAAVLFIAQGGFFLLMSFVVPAAAPRMDHSLFTRAAHDLLPGALPDSVSVPQPPAHLPNPAKTLGFARFLGRQLLIEDFRRTPEGLELRLARVVTNVLASAVPFYWGKTSRAVLGHDGNVRVHLGDVDRRELSVSVPEDLPPPATLESRVTHALQQSRAAFDSGDEAVAASQLGTRDNDSIFQRNPSTTFAMRWRVWTLRLAAVLLPVAGILMMHNSKLQVPNLAPASHFPPTAITETDVRDFLAQLAPDHPGHADAQSMFQHGLHVGVCLPPADLFPKELLPSIKSMVLGPLASNTPASTPLPIQLGWALGSPAFLKAASSGFLSTEDLRPHRLDPDSVRTAIPLLPSDLRHSLLGLQEVPVEGQRYPVLTTRELAERVRFLAQSRCLDLIDFSPIIPTLVACQILSTNAVGNRFQAFPLNHVQGLFQSRIGDFLRDTRDILFLLESAGALDEIDREACIAGILRLHRGEGIFLPEGSPAAGLIRCDAVNTWFAFESLRILGALDRVPDLARWRFRTSPGEFGTGPGGTRVLLWESLEAWCLNREFAKHFAPPSTMAAGIPR